MQFNRERVSWQIKWLEVECGLHSMLCAEWAVDRLCVVKNGSNGFGLTTTAVAVGCYRTFAYSKNEWAEKVSFVALHCTGAANDDDAKYVLER